MVSDIAQRVVWEGAEDWVPIIDIVHRVRSADPALAHEGLRDAVLGVIRELVQNELMVIGDLRDGPHAPWSMSDSEAFSKIESEWDFNLDPAWGMSIWLANTPTGQDLAATLELDESGLDDL